MTIEYQNGWQAEMEEQGYLKDCSKEDYLRDQQALLADLTYRMTNMSRDPFKKCDP